MLLLAAALVAAGVWLAVPPPPDARVATVLPVAAPRRISARLSPRIACLAAAIGVALLMPGPIGVGLAAAVGLGGPAVVTRLEPSSARRRRERITAQAPIIADVLAAAMATGVPLTVALDTVAAAVGCPGGDVLAATSRSLALGSDRAWTALAAEESLRPIGEALSRASRTGAPLADVLANIADDLRRRHVGAVEVAARAAGVRAILPLATCFLPAFLLLGVVPVVAALAAPYFAR